MISNWGHWIGHLKNSVSVNCHDNILILHVMILIIILIFMVIKLIRTVAHHVSKRCAERKINLIDLVKLEVYDQVYLDDEDATS